MEMDIDRISSLPEPVQETILLRLPVKDTIRTSVLSRQWRSRWANLPEVKVNDKGLEKDELVKLIDRLLLLHTGQIQAFHLHLGKLECFAEIDGWILFLSRRGVRDIALKFEVGELYKLPSHLYSCQDLEHLQVSGCIFRQPPSFQCFEYLTELHLHYVTIDPNVLENLVSKCVRLNGLRLYWIEGCSNLKIHNPNLGDIKVWSDFEDICFTNTENLYHVEIASRTLPAKGKTGSLVEFFSSLPAIQILAIDNSCLKYLILDGVPEIPPLVCVHLWELSVEVNFRVPTEISAALYLFKCTPNIEELQIMASEETTSMEEPVQSILHTPGIVNFSFHLLKKVKFIGFTGLKPELDMISFLLTNSRVLEKMIIKSTLEEASKASKELLQFKRASAHAQIFLD
ncbi:hypothetical protein IFM89_037071 [Coptis chinensis]|uniref:FBD domain-containing protein n=1 Tax=Coptis chinensis TaxID=261450 RepID=A0A835HSE4_9MAGN|nr:hypothetical protein IFM89_037071 [Coptis chinensis]